VNLPTNYSVTDMNGAQVVLFGEDALDIICCQKVAAEFIKSTA
jgi:hypothetical protein